MRLWTRCVQDIVVREMLHQGSAEISETRMSICPKCRIELGDNTDEDFIQEHFAGDRGRAGIYGSAKDKPCVPMAYFGAQGLRACC